MPSQKISLLQYVQKLNKDVKQSGEGLCFDMYHDDVMVMFVPAYVANVQLHLL